MTPDKTRKWDTLAQNKAERLARAGQYADGKVVATERIGLLLNAVLEPGDRVCVEGNNQKHADFLAAEMAKLDPQIVHDLHIIQSNIALPAHLDLFERGIAARLDFCYSGEQGVRMARLIKAGKIKVGAIHTYLELYGRYFMDLSPRVSLVVAQSELYGKTVIEAVPLSEQAQVYRNLAKYIDENQDSVIPKPLNGPELKKWAREWGDRIFDVEAGVVHEMASI